MQYTADNTTIPIPKVHCCFEDDDAVYLIMEYIEGVTMNEGGEEAAVFEDLEPWPKPEASERGLAPRGPNTTR